MENIKVIVHDDRSWKEKLKDGFLAFKYDVKVKLATASVWLANHWVDACKVLILALPVATHAVKFIRICRGSSADCREYRMQKCYYDPSTGAHWKLKRDLTNREQSELLLRKRSGEYAEDILRDMKILK